ncbi:MAG: hypothetical protein ACOYO1_19030 [Bacteroidales bacterium]
MKKITLLFIFIAFVFFATNTEAQSAKKRKEAGWMVTNYEVECMGTGMDGTQLIKVWGYAKKPNDAILQAKKNAVHAIIFKGVTAGKPGCMTRPLSTEPGAEEKHNEYYETFFTDGGPYLKFISISGEGAEDRVKVGKMYKCAIVVSVNHSALRKELEAAGVIKKLDAGF